MQLLADIASDVDARAKHNAEVKKERNIFEMNAKRDRARLNESIAAARAELATVDRFLAAEKPRTRKGSDNA